MLEDLTPQSPMPDTIWSAGSLRITSRTIGTAEISALLGIVPDDHFEKGSLTSPRNPDSARRESNVWIRRSGLGDDRWPEEHAAALVRLLTGRRQELLHLADSCDLELVLGFGSENGQSGCVLPATLLLQIAGLGLDVVLDLYPPASDDTPTEPK